MQKKRVLIQTSNHSNISRLRDKIEANLYAEVVITDNDKASRNVTKTQKVHTVIYDTEEFTLDGLRLVRDLRGLGGITPVLILGQEIQSDIQGHLISMERVNFLAKPYDVKDAIGLTRKLIAQQALKQQQFQRFRTDQLAFVEPFDGTEPLNSTIYNLSEGGAYLEFEQDHELKIGDVLKVSVQLSETASNYNLNAKVVWRTRKGRFSGKQGVGCQFVRADEVYLALLERV